MSLFPCPYLKGEVELTDERERHIAERHPELLPEHRVGSQRPSTSPIKFAGALGSGAPGCSRDGTLIFTLEST